MKNSTKVGLVAMCLAASILVPRACDYVSEKKEEKLERQEEEQRRQEKERMAKEAAAEEAREQAESAYFDKVLDSLLYVKGYNKSDVEKAKKLRDAAREDADASWNVQRSSLTGRLRMGSVYYGNTGHDKTQQSMLYYDIEKMIGEKSKQYATEISKLLDKYNLKIPGTYEQSEEIAKLTDMFVEYFSGNDNYGQPRLNGYINAQEVAQESNKWLVYRLVYNMGIMPEKEYSEYSDVKKIYWRDYGEARQDEVRAAVKSIVEKMVTDMDKAVVEIARKYAKYYPVLTDIKNIPAQYAEYLKDVVLWDEVGESGDACPGDISGDLVITRSIRVYDSKLPVSFFGEKGASYKLVSVQPGKWQVVRTDKNGKVSKTAVFSHDTDYELELRHNWTDSKVGNSTFSYEPGANMGVHVYATEVVYVKEREIKDDKLPQKEYDRLFAQQDARYDSLQSEYARKTDLADSLSHEPDSIYWEARSIAYDKLKEYRQSREKAEAALAQFQNQKRR